ncbi:hypothetical protein [Streptomyces sp. NPDC057336]|uniref:hypothetical protein n=1 Tax=Streptomyces sp. NPDC057336 TaxID=3346102 RepID=UPI003637DDBA
MLGELNRVREAALARGVPPAEVERWLEAARPCATLTHDGDGPVVGRFGGPLLLPVESPGPPARPYLIASVDLAALPPDATTLPLPSDGVPHLLARSADDGFDAAGEAVYVPAGTPVEERPLGPGHSPEDPWANMGRGPHEGTELRLRRAVSLPDCEATYDPAEHPTPRSRAMPGDRCATRTGHTAGPCCGSTGTPPTLTASSTSLARRRR